MLPVPNAPRRTGKNKGGEILRKWSPHLRRYANNVNKKLFAFAIFAGITIVLFASLYSNVKPQLLDVKPMTTAEQTIRSPITFEDEAATEIKVNEALSQLKPVYTLKLEYAENQVKLIGSIFDAAIALSNEIEQIRQKAQIPVEDGEEAIVEPSTEEKVDMLKEDLSKDVVDNLSDSTLRALVTSSKADLQMAKDLTVTAVNNVMTTRISATEVENAKKRVEDELRFISLPQNLKNAAIELGRFAIIQNEFYDPEATEVLRQKTIESVEPVMILAGQVIVEEGEIITQNKYDQLVKLGLVNDKQPILPFIGLGLFILILIGFIYSFFHEQKRNLNGKELVIYAVVLVVSVIFMKLTSIIPHRQYDLSFIYPAAMCAMLIKLLLNERLAFLSSILLASLGTIMFNDTSSIAFNFSVGLYILISCLAGIIFLTNQSERSKIFQAGIFVSIINIIVISVIHFIPNTQYSAMQYAIYFLMGMGSGLGSAVLTIGFIPFFEAGFGILSTMKLIELANPNHPLLKKILTEAPGTYHHSVMVANLADRACEAIGANGLLARVSCYYHDIGKTVRPTYFIENQLSMDNPHDELDPVISKDIIVSHTIDGADILRKHKMPKEIVDIALQHHGTSIIKYFYHKAKESGADVEEEDFRYPGPKPQTIEAAVISIADSVEAAVRSMKNPTKEKIEALVKNIIKDRIQDQQFSECDITLKQLDIVEKTLCESLNGIFHNRIEYPKPKEER